MLEMVGICLLTHLVAEKTIDTFEPLRNFCRAQTMIHASSLTVNALQETIQESVQDSFTQVQKSVLSTIKQVQQGRQQQVAIAAQTERPWQHIIQPEGAI